ncbi:MAG: murein biosynthesis integral membrane protein MurJ [Candidatus Nanopelagicales bacterium]
MSDPVTPSEDAAGVDPTELGGVADVEADATRSVVRSSALMAAGTITSRITGVLRDIAITAALGSAILADTYALGNSLPNIIYILVIGGALNAIFIPQLVRHMRTDADGGDGYADRLITLVGLILVAATVLAIVCAPWIVEIYTTSSFTDEQLSLATAFARFCLPQIVFYGLYTMFSQVLNSRMHFGAPMFAPIVNNVVMIATALGFIFVAGTTATTSTITSGQVMWLGIGTTLGVAAQAAVLVPVLIRVGYKWRPRFDFRGHGLGKAGSLAGWTIGLVLVNQVGFLVISRLATQANFLAEQSGGVPQGLATYQRAFLVFMLPHSVITISLVTALFPRMSKSAAVGALRDVAHDVAEGIRLIAALLLPCVMFLVAFGPMLGTVFFGFGANRGAPATYTGLVVSVFALGMLPFGIFYILLRGWYAVEDTRTPFYLTVIYNLIAMPLTFLLFSVAPSELAVCALALAYGLAYWITISIAWVWLSRRLGGLETGLTVRTLARMSVAAFVAAALGLGAVVVWAVFVGGGGVDGIYQQLTADQLTSLFVLIGGGVVTVFAYLALSHLLRVTEVQSVTSSLTSKLRP